MKRLARLLVAVALVAGLVFAGVGCNTVEGLGEDIQRGGERLEDAADDT